MPKRESQKIMMSVSRLEATKIQSRRAGKGTGRDIHTALKCFAYAYFETESDDMFDVIEDIMTRGISQ
ncbi:11452_t:CDS:2 [Ambispora gerdemannii]|uniref:11452_t:CDS:1 n=1 Tax=Ambispora gerdemannii TaxID=144530 RepID=A0A9N9G7E9_9GLOM|nr:11452_t:CDS:2 [Ambispora gerdemannii]